VSARVAWIHVAPVKCLQIHTRERVMLTLRRVEECWTTLAALAEATHRVEIGTLMLCNSFRDPAILAKMATTADAVKRSSARPILAA